MVVTGTGLVILELVFEYKQKKNRGVNKLQFWFNSNSLMISTEKTVAMSFRTLQKKSLLKPQITFYSMGIADKSETKFMGVRINENKK